MGLYKTERGKNFLLKVRGEGALCHRQSRVDFKNSSERKTGEGGARMSENLLYADLNLTEPTRPSLYKVTDVQGSTYAEVKVQSLDTNAVASYTSSGKRRCSRTCVAVLVAVVILLLVLVVCLVLIYYPTVSSPHNSKLSSATAGEALGCPHPWEKNGKKCYFFSQELKKNDWNASRKECTDMGSDLVIIENKEELDYLASQSTGHYYLLGLKRSKNEKWKWINDVEHSKDMFNIGGDVNYCCAVIGHGKVETASCYGSSTTQNMCEKAANITERQEK
ncbi:C-type lectin domain family 5 member A-like isoform X1 [Falco biarmicus]|uniref:C-type lectin domain family 5 member A-like isoform X1 n=2 Tax=Falco TaxID=8952 RepID=UPI0024785D40|nr:C-type lectin domain family 5 member A-like isoform X1 [Falco peregrinus]XP_014141114.2 C-type lectin domain family 5 member A-like isoform X1 [Falco cherrug]XP_056196741.1 C-type lectin domain family 5 member A-like isoform X1 [Falco biarmicus]